MKKIPKVINYMWFGKNPISKETQKCIESWRKYLPDYKIIEWNESNFDINSCQYVKEAYASKKWAFVSDYARLVVLEQYGGLYFDTDMELIKPINDIVDNGSFINLEKTAEETIMPAMSAIGAEPHLPLFQELIREYQSRHFILKDGELDETPIGTFVYNFIKNENYILFDDRITTYQNVKFYPFQYFSPQSYASGEIYISNLTRGIHHYAASWHTLQERKATKIVQRMTALFGKKVGKLSHKCVFGFYDTKQIFKNQGMIPTIKFIGKKIGEREDE